MRYDAPMSLAGLVLGEELGHGGMGTVYAATRDGEPVAVKVLTGDRVALPEYLAAFRTEVRAMATLAHPGIVRVLDYGVVEPGHDLPMGSPYVVMELAPESLRDRCGRATWPEVRAWLEQLLEALAHAHARGITHRDLKPANVLLADGHVKIADFGLARAFETDGRGQHEQPAGTPGYMPPEQRQGRWRDIGPWTDLYALGRLTLDLITLPRGGTIPVPRRLDAWVSRLRQEKLPERYCRAADALEGLRSLAEEELGVLDAVLGGVGPAADTDFAVTQPYFEDEDQVLAALPDPLPRSPLAPPAHPISVPETPAGRGVGLRRLRPARLLGREEEQGVLWTGVKRAHAGHVELIALRGPGGVGKRDLAMWLCHQIHQTGAGSVNLATHQSHPGPRAGLAGMIARELRCLDIDRKAAFRRVSRFLADHPHPRSTGQSEWEAAALLKLMAPALGPGERPPVSLGPQEQGFELVARFLEREAGTRLPFVWLEQLQLAHGTLAWVEWLRQRGGRFLLVATIEGRGLDDWLGELGATVLDLEPLSSDDRARCIETTVGILNPETARALAAAVGQNTVLAGHVFDDWCAQGKVRADHSAVGELPTSIDAAAVWESRIDRVLVGRDRYAPRALAAAAVLGMEVNAVRWRDVLRRARVSLDPGLTDGLLAEGLAVSLGLGDSADFRFSDRAVRQGLLERWREEVPRLHRAAALSFRIEPETVLRRAFHLEQAGDPRAAVLALKGAVSVLVVMQEWQLLEDVLRTLRSILEREDIPEARAWSEVGQLALDSRAKVGADQLDRALQVAERAEPWPSAHGAACFFAGRGAHSAGQLELAERMLSVARTLAGTEQDALAAEADANLGVIRYHQARFEEALDLLASAEERRKDPTGVLSSAVFKASAYAHLGDEERAGRELDAVAHLVKSAGWLPRAAFANALGERARRLGQHEAAATHYAMAFQAARVANDRSAWVYRLNQALANILRHRIEGVDVQVDEAIAELEAVQHVQYAASGRVIRLVIAARNGDLETWDRLVGAFEEMDELGAFDQDLALAGELAAGAMEVYDPDRAQVAAQFARRQRAGLEGPERLQ